MSAICSTPAITISSSYTHLSKIEDLEKTSAVNLNKGNVRLFKQYVAAVIVTLTFFMMGSNSGWSGPTLPKLLAADSPIPITNSEASWLAALIQFGSIIGPIFTFGAAKFIGRKPIIMCIAPLFLISSLMISFATSVSILLIARLICGLAYGACETVIPLYIGEISSPKIRGKLGAFMLVQFYLAFLIEFSVAPYITVASNGLMLSIIPFLFLFLSVFLPETPYYFLMRGDTMNAKKSLVWLRGTTDVNEELIIMETVAKEQEKEQKGFFDLIVIPSNRKALLIVLGLSTAQQFVGTNAIVSYAQLIFEEARGSLSPEISGILLAITSFIVAGISSLLVDSWGRRPLLITSSLCTSIPLITTGCYFYLQSVQFEYISQISLLPLISFLVFNLAYSLGLSFLPLVCLGELFPTNVRTIAACVSSVYASFAAFLVIKTYQILADAFSTQALFWGFASCGIISAILIYFFVPETKNKSLEEIQVVLKK